MHSYSAEVDKAVRWAQVIFLLLALAMAVFGMVTLFRHNAPPWVAILMILDAVLLGVAGGLISRRSTLIHLLAVLLAAGNAVLSVTDQFGWADALVLSGFLVLLLILVVARRHFLPLSQKG